MTDVVVRPFFQTVCRMFEEGHFVHCPRLPRLNGDTFSYSTLKLPNLSNSSKFIRSMKMRAWENIGHILLYDRMVQI